MTKNPFEPLGESVLGNYFSIREAARRIGRGSAYVRGLVESGRLEAIQCGGTQRFPRLKVNLDDLKRAVLDNVYVPKGAEDKQRPRRRKCQQKWRDFENLPEVSGL
jgi:excisionase family DNA binding protein